VGSGFSLNLSSLNLDLPRGDEPRSTARRDKDVHLCAGPDRGNEVESGKIITP